MHREQFDRIPSAVALWPDFRTGASAGSGRASHSSAAAAKMPLLPFAAKDNIMDEKKALRVKRWRRGERSTAVNRLRGYGTSLEQRGPTSCKAPTSTSAVTPARERDACKIISGAGFFRYPNVTYPSKTP